MSQQFRMTDRQKLMLRLIPVGLSLLAILIVALTAIRIDSIKPNEIGVIINNLSGGIEVRLQAGSFFYNGLYKDVYKIDKSVKRLEMSRANGQRVGIKTRDGSNINLDVEINYALVPNEKDIREKILVESGVGKIPSQILTSRKDRRGRVRQVSQTVMLEAYQAKWVREYSRAVVRYIYGELATKEWYDAAKRDAKTRKVRDELDKLLREHGIQVIKVVPDRFYFEDQCETKIKEKKDADQEHENQVQQAKTQEQIQARRIVEAEKEAEVAIAKTRGELDRKRIAAEAVAIQDKKRAEAYSIQTRIGADASLYEAERKSKGILAAAKAEAEGLTNLINALEGEGGRNLVIRSLAERLRKARIEGLPYATNSLIQKVSVENAAAASKGSARKGGDR